MDSNDDDLKMLIDELGSEDPRSIQEQNQMQSGILKKAQSKQSQADLLEFGFVKLWTIILEFLSFFYVNSKQLQNTPQTKTSNWSKK